MWLFKLRSCESETYRNWFLNRFFDIEMIWLVMFTKKMIRWWQISLILNPYPWKIGSVWCVDNQRNKAWGNHVFRKLSAVTIFSRKHDHRIDYDQFQSHRSKTSKATSFVRCFPQILMTYLVAGVIVHRSYNFHNNNKNITLECIIINTIWCLYCKNE